MLARRFVGRDGLWYFDGNDLTRGLHVRNPESIFFERGFNTMVRGDATEDDSVERTFAQTESGIAPLLTFIVDTVRENTVPIFQDDAREGLALFTFQLAKRPPEIRRQRLSEEAIVASLEASILNAEVRAGRKLTDEELDYFKDKAWLDRYVKATQATVAADPGRFAVPALIKQGMFFIRAPQHKSFVLGSNPLRRLGEAFGAGGQAAWPIAPDIALCFGERTLNNTIQYLSDDQLRSFNEGVWAQSDSIASDSKDLIASLAKKSLRNAAKLRREASVRFGKSA